MGLMKTLFGGSDGGGSRLDATQQPFLKDIYNQAQSLYGDTSGQEYSKQFQQPAFGAFNQMAGGGYTVPGLQKGLMNFGNQQNKALSGAIDSGLWQINNNLQRNILPSISAGAVGSGTSGGSRQGIAEGLALSDANQQATNFINEMQSGNWGQQMNNQLGAYQGLTDIQGQKNQAMQGALSVAPDVQNLGFGSQYGNLQAYKNIVGAPTVLGNSTSQQNGMFAPMQLTGKPLFGG